MNRRDQIGGKASTKKKNAFVESYFKSAKNNQFAKLMSNKPCGHTSSGMATKQIRISRRGYLLFLQFFFTGIHSIVKNLSLSLFATEAAIYTQTDCHNEPIYFPISGWRETLVLPPSN